MTGLRKQKLDAGLDLVRGLVPREMTKPNSPEFYPPDDYFRRGLIARGWTEAEIKSASA